MDYRTLISGDAMSRTSLVLILCFFVPLAVSARVIRVPEDHASIGEALFSALPADTILVAPGTYVENIIWPDTPGLKLLSEAGPELTILDGNAEETVIGIYTGVDTTTIIRGFTIRNGYVEGQ